MLHKMVERNLKKKTNQHRNTYLKREMNNIFVVMQVISGVRIRILSKDFDQLFSDAFCEEVVWNGTVKTY